MIKIGSARSDEKRKYSGGIKGDQRQTSTPDNSGEVSMQDFYVHSKGWLVIHTDDDEIGHKLAVAMKKACNNKNIGYSQSDRYGIITFGVDTKKSCNCDCSSLVRACLKYAGIEVNDFNTSTEANVLKQTGKFTVYPYTKLTKLYNGDILVTKVKGHTVIIVSGAKRRK